MKLNKCQRRTVRNSTRAGEKRVWKRMIKDGRDVGGDYRGCYFERAEALGSRGKNRLSYLTHQEDSNVCDGGRR